MHRNKILFAGNFVDIPGPVAHLWDWFWQLDQSRQYGDFPQALAWHDVAAWAGLHAISPHPWELQAIMSMDIARRTALSETGQQHDQSGINFPIDMNNADAVKAFFKGFAPKD